ncbi:MAG: RNA 2',3'-cyclic phosphodiesterase [Planctomycetota bacterium]
MLMRAFLAVLPSDDVRRGYGRFLRELKGSSGVVRWVSMENFHLTLKFLGETDVNRFPETGQALQEALAGIPPFDVTVRGMGAFPNTAKPRVVWMAGVEEADAAVMRTMAGKVERAMADLGFPRDEKPFRPHWTIGRVRGGSADFRDLGELIWKWRDRALGTMTVDHVALMTSELLSDGPVYRVAGRYPLGESATVEDDDDKGSSGG